VDEGDEEEEEEVSGDEEDADVDEDDVEDGGGRANWPSTSNTTPFLRFFFFVSIFHPESLEV